MDDAQQGGRIKGEHLADAWDLQMDIESANLNGDHIVGALLDYETFFDYFHLGFVRALLLRVGLPQGIADQVFNLYSPIVYEVGDIIDTYVYRIGLIGFDYSFATAVGLFKNLAGFALVVVVNFATRRVTGHGLW